MKLREFASDLILMGGAGVFAYGLYLWDLRPALLFLGACGMVYGTLLGRAVNPPAASSGPHAHQGDSAAPH